MVSENIKKIALDSLVFLLFVASSAFLISTFIPFGDNYINSHKVYLLLGIVTSAFIYLISAHNKHTFYAVSLFDFLSIIKSALLVLVCNILVLFILSHNVLSAFSVASIIAASFVLALTINRIIARVNFYGNRKQGAVRTLIVGAGNCSELFIRETMRKHYPRYNIIGSIDDDKKKIGSTIHGIPILGSLSQISDIIKENKIELVILTIQLIDKKHLKQLIEKTLDLKVPLKRIPPINAVIASKKHFSQLINFSIEDLLCRDQIDINNKKLDELIEGKTLLVSGAGGSIGSELSVQIASHRPKKLILLDYSEIALYTITEEIKTKFKTLDSESIICDIRDESRVVEVVSKYMPDHIFHAAAYKHVNIVEKNPFEGIKTNVLGTLNMAKTACGLKINQFTLVSTDKAVNPTNIMGATKRVAELICQYFSKSNTTKFNAVRFGNVLNSSGSVVRKFDHQVVNGGPVTVTHPDVIRYFMTIPEAAKLVLQSATDADNGQIFVLKMGEPVKILNLAENIIMLSGLRPYQDIEIKFTGLCPGEKLYEELLCNNENTVPTDNKDIMIIKVPKPGSDLVEKVKNLLLDKNNVKENLKNIVPEYEPYNEEEVIDD